jgi:hypothetical protein
MFMNTCLAGAGMNTSQRNTPMAPRFLPGYRPGKSGNSGSYICNTLHYIYPAMPSAFGQGLQYRCTTYPDFFNLHYISYNYIISGPGTIPRLIR